MIDTKTQTLKRVNIGGSNRLAPGIEKTYTGIVSGGIYRFTADVAFLSSGGGGIFVPSGMNNGTQSLFTTVQDSVIFYKVTSTNPLVLTRIAGMRYSYGTSTGPVSYTFTASGSNNIVVKFVPGNVMSTTHSYYIDNMKLARLTGSTIYTSNFTATTITSQNTDGWSTNWATSYMNVLTGPNRLRVSGQAPNIQRNFSVAPNDNYELTYTQSENNSVTFVVEQSPNGSSGWNTLMNTTSANGTQTKYFTPSQAYVRVRVSGSAAFSLSNMTLVGTHSDTSYTLIARGGYRYGFQSQERDDEIKGAGNSVNYTFRMHDPRIGRFFAVDPLAADFSWNSPYAFSANRVINAIELEGLETFDCYTFTDETDPRLTQTVVYKTKQDGDQTINYHKVDKNGNITTTDTGLSDFRDGSAEKYAMNQSYYDSYTRKTWAKKDGLALVSDVKYNSDSKSMKAKYDLKNMNGNRGNQIVYQYEISLLFKPNKAEIMENELQSGTYEKAMGDIFSLHNMLEKGGISFNNNYIEMSNYNLVINGETDSQLSSPPFPSVNGQPEGNASLGLKRALNLESLMTPCVEERNSVTGKSMGSEIQVVNHKGRLNNKDRNASVLIIPKIDAISK